MTPFIVYALPRSRTFWLSKFLSFGDYQCGHDQMRHIRGMDDVRSWFSQGFVGTCETAAAPWWRLVADVRPDARVLVVRRPVADVVESLMRVDMRGVASFDRDVLTRRMEQMDRRLDHIARQPGVMSVGFAELEREDVCAAVFEHCLPYKHSHDWWAAFAPINLTIDMPALARYCAAHRRQMSAAVAECRLALRDVLTVEHEAPDLDGVTIQEEDFETFWRDGTALFAEHCRVVGEAPDSYLGKNVELMRRIDGLGMGQIMTARCNGRMFGYLATIIGPSMEDASLVSATQSSFFVSRDFKGLGVRLQKASIEGLRRRGVGEVILSAGVRGSGSRLGTLYRRLGAKDAGQIYRLKLEAA